MKRGAMRSKMMCDSDIQKDSDCLEKIEEFREKQSRLLEEAEQKLAQEKNRIGMEKVRENFSPRLATLKNQQDKLREQLILRQSEFNRMNESDHPCGSDRYAGNYDSGHADDSRIYAGDVRILSCFEHLFPADFFHL